MARLKTGTKLRMLTARLPEDTAAEIDEIIKASGMYETHFLAAALVLGARSLARTMCPERQWTPEMFRNIGEGMTNNLLGKADLDALANMMKGVIPGEIQQEE